MQKSSLHGLLPSENVLCDRENKWKNFLARYENMEEDMDDVFSMGASDNESNGDNQSDDPVVEVESDCEDFVAAETEEEDDFDIQSILSNLQTLIKERTKQWAARPILPFVFPSSDGHSQLVPVSQNIQPVVAVSNTKIVKQSAVHRSSKVTRDSVKFSKTVTTTTVTTISGGQVYYDNSNPRRSKKKSLKMLKLPMGHKKHQVQVASPTLRVSLHHNLNSKSRSSLNRPTTKSSEVFKDGKPSHAPLRSLARSQKNTQKPELESSSLENTSQELDSELVEAVPVSRAMANLSENTTGISKDQRTRTVRRNHKPYITSEIQRIPINADSLSAGENMGNKGAFVCSDPVSNDQIERKQKKVIKDEELRNANLSPSKLKKMSLKDSSHTIRKRKNVVSKKNNNKKMLKHNESAILSCFEVPLMKKCSVRLCRIIPKSDNNASSADKCMKTTSVAAKEVEPVGPKTEELPQPIDEEQNSTQSTVHEVNAESSTNLSHEVQLKHNNTKKSVTFEESSLQRKRKNVTVVKSDIVEVNQQESWYDRKILAQNHCSSYENSTMTQYWSMNSTQGSQCTMSCANKAMCTCDNQAILIYSPAQKRKKKEYFVTTSNLTKAIAEANRTEEVGRLSFNDINLKLKPNQELYFIPRTMKADERKSNAIAIAPDRVDVLNIFATNLEIGYFGATQV